MQHKLQKGAPHQFTLECYSLPSVNGFSARKTHNLNNSGMVRAGKPLDRFCVDFDLK
jgi:hypothetical protein